MANEVRLLGYTTASQQGCEGSACTRTVLAWLLGIILNP